MSDQTIGRIGAARAAADLAEGTILATVEVAVPAERAFTALAGTEIVAWWIRPGVFNTLQWSGEVKVGGNWRAAGVGGGRPYVLEGEFLEVDPPRSLRHSWKASGAPAAATTVSYRLEPVPGGTRITLRHSGIASPQVCANTCIGWETSFEQLAVFLSAERQLPQG